MPFGQPEDVVVFAFKFVRRKRKPRKLLPLTVNQSRPSRLSFFECLTVWLCSLAQSVGKCCGQCTDYFVPGSFRDLFQSRQQEREADREGWVPLCFVPDVQEFSWSLNMTFDTVSFAFCGLWRGSIHCLDRSKILKHKLNSKRIAIQGSKTPTSQPWRDSVKSRGNTSSANVCL